MASEQNAAFLVPIDPLFTHLALAIQDLQSRCTDPCCCSNGSELVTINTTLNFLDNNYLSVLDATDTVITTAAVGDFVKLSAEFVQATNTSCVEGRFNSGLMDSAFSFGSGDFSSTPSLWFVFQENNLVLVSIRVCVYMRLRDFGIPLALNRQLQVRCNVKQNYALANMVHISHFFLYIQLESIGYDFSACGTLLPPCRVQESLVRFKYN